MVAVWSASGARSARTVAGNCTVRVLAFEVCKSRKGTSSPDLVTVVSDGSEPAAWYPWGSIRLQPNPLATCSGELLTKSARSQPAWLPSLTSYQSSPEAPGARASPVAWLPCDRVASRPPEAV